MEQDTLGRTAYARAIDTLDVALDEHRAAGGDGPLAVAAANLVALLRTARGKPISDGGNIIDKVLAEAAASLWFTDRSKHGPTLWVIAKDLDPSIAEACARTCPAPLRNMDKREERAIHTYVHAVLAHRLAILEPDVFSRHADSPLPEPPDIGQTLWAALKECKDTTSTD